ncbi:hypothetical protein NDU88_003091 [Pleurodeles waltl]|uniref:PARP catalytic domain-containing protein n=1 Tax=Pleurodeles waltl TaxID=8319 RepID=A0AAV7MQN0_PLEWA|nr:hypothetical protein NDU88_003091 [Pleurodeles waltl]
MVILSRPLPRSTRRSPLESLAFRSFKETAPWQKKQARTKMKLLVAVIVTLFVVFSAALTEDLKDGPSNVLCPHPESVPLLSRSRRSYGRKEYVMYHGTSVNAAFSIIRNGFKPSKDGMLGPGVYVSRDIRKAQGYPANIPPHERVILKVKVRVGKVKKIDRQGHPLQRTWHLYGYDTAWVPPNCGMVPSGLQENCIWDPKRIKILDVVQAPAYAMPQLKSILPR